ncbi:alpha-N-methyltransferase NTM1 [Chaetomium tenue]|uniref:Alpha-N-methyltransferase NTM1 n=1 Tax=Chaetomium tenue TaxID=1854479 RepID=A0ACB7PGP3_9PEZI|nr:alpha-N-methyltransferase NTM1 [Chaetomium globosum]
MTSNDSKNENVDSLINRDDGRKYWEDTDATVHGMLGGHPHVSRVELRGSRNFLAKIGIGSKPGQRVAINALEGGAGIGRVTEGLLLDGIAQHVDIIEPIAKFTAQLQGKQGVRNIFNMGLEDWEPSGGVQYDLIWIQWCAAYLTDKQLVQFLERCKLALNPDGGVIVLKENTSPAGEDMFDDVDSSVTRGDDTYRRCVTAAGFRLIKTELQKGLVTGVKLLPVRMYALRPRQP